MPATATRHAWDGQLVRSGIYGSFLSGGFAGHVYGAEGIWGAYIEPTAPTKMWDAFQWSSGADMKHFPRFAMAQNGRYQELVPIADLVSPNKTEILLSYDGWAYCARTPDKEFFLAYFEPQSAAAEIRGAKLNAKYRARWFNPRNGEWSNAGDGVLPSNKIGVIALPSRPSAEDWGLELVLDGKKI